MCGIAGAFTVGPCCSRRDLVVAIVDSQKSRGPDHQAVEVVENRRSSIALGHDRLSIIDLSPDANQPMWDRSGRFAVVFNGEIYNYVELRSELERLGHRFRTLSDTEVLLEAFKEWGEDALDRFIGMFAFGLYDRDHERLVLVRDRFGKKPLFYALVPDGIVFASTGEEIARELKLAPDEIHLARWIRGYSYDDVDRSPYKGLNSVRPGHILTAELDKAGRFDWKTRAYYDLEERAGALAEELASQPVSELAVRLHNLLANAVDLRFRADVPVAVSLSGGMDSSAVAAMAAKRQEGTVIGYCFGNATDRKTEGPIVAGFAAQTGIEARFVDPPIRDIICSFIPTVNAQDAPFRSAGIMAQNLVYRQVAQDGIRVLMGGQGGDEALMGYITYRFTQLTSLIRSRELTAALGAACQFIPTLWHERSFFERVAKKQLKRFAGHSPGSVIILPPLDRGVFRTLDSSSLSEHQMCDIRSDLPTLLRYEDRNSMAHSIESRLPFMDHRIMEFGVALPTAAKLNRGYGKWILRQAMTGAIPDNIRLAKFKNGFGVKQSEWIARGLGDEIRRALRERESLIRRWLPQGVTVESAFSDAQLIGRPAAFSDATVLTWLADRTG